MARLISCPLAFRFAFCFFHCFAHLGSWARNVGLLKQTACQWYLLQQQCQELITLWPICKHYIAHDTRTFNPYRYQSSFLNSTTLIISYYLVRNSAWRRNISSVENSSHPIGTLGQRHAPSPCAIPHNQMEVDTAKFIKTQNLYRVQTSKWVNNSYQKTRLSYQHWINTHNTK